MTEAQDADETEPLRERIAALIQGWLEEPDGVVYLAAADAVLDALGLEQVGYISPKGNFQHYVDVTSDEEWMAEWPDDRRVYAIEAALAGRTEGSDGR